jgi:hypothetical protein
MMHRTFSHNHPDAAVTSLDGGGGGTAMRSEGDVDFDWIGVVPASSLRRSLQPPSAIVQRSHFHAR